jgi:phosphatidylglycerophosphatase A
MNAPHETAVTPEQTPAPQRPTVRFMLAHPAHCHRAGLWRRPVTQGAGHRGHAVGLAGLLVLQHWLSPLQMGLLIAGSARWWAGGPAPSPRGHMGVSDPGSIVWDEVVAFWLVLWLAMPMGFWGQAVAFALFRFFDAAKPGPWLGRQPVQGLWLARRLGHFVRRLRGRLLHTAGDCAVEVLVNPPHPD